MSLSRYIRENDWSALEDAWTEHTLGDADIAPALEALRHAADRKEIPRVIAFVRDHAEVLSSAERHAEAAKLLGTTMLLGGSPGELASALYKNSEKAWGEESYWPRFIEISHLAENMQDMRSGWRTFQKLLSLEPGRVVYHGKGWGLGRIDRVDHGEDEVHVTFLTGRADRFPFQTSVDIFDVLEPTDLRAMVVLDPDELNRKLKKEPLEILRWVARRSPDHKATHAGIKLALGTLGVEGASFTAFWRRARKAAETSQWFEVSGSTTKAQVRLLDVAADPAEGFRRQLLRSDNLSQALTRVRALLSGGNADEEVRSAALETLGEMAVEENQPLSSRLGTWLFLKDQLGETPEQLAEMLSVAAAHEPPTDPSIAPALWELFQHAPGAREQDNCIPLLQEIYGDSWLDEASRHLPHAAAGMARGLVDQLEAAGRRDELLVHYASLLVRPTRNPMVLVRLADLLEEGDEIKGLPAPLQRAQCLLQLAGHVFKKSVANQALTRARAKLSSILGAGKPPLLLRLLKGASLESLRGLASMLETGVDREVDRLFTRVAIEVAPDVFKDDSKYFWQAGGIWTTKAGLARREGELRELRDVKIPANAEAIGKAASYGDLSENSEWEAAIEEQRNLTTRAMELEAELREASLLENAAIPEDTVAPGTRVSYRDSSGEHTITIMGPWDEGEQNLVSYRSPLAVGMMGLHPGDRAEVTLPTGSVAVEVLEIELVDF